MEEKELTVREAMLLVLDKSSEEFERMKECFKRASDAFDVANDQAGLEIVSKDIFPHVRSLTEFCSSIFEYHIEILGMEYAQELNDRNAQLNALLERLVKETAAGNFTEVGDILRFDFYDLINDLNQFFIKIRPRFVDSQNSQMDQY